MSAIRLKDNASDAFLEISSTINLQDTFAKLPQCKAIVATGKKAAQTIADICHCQEPREGGHLLINYPEREFTLYRMPSSSRAYPKSLQAKAKIYANMFKRENIL